MHPARCPAARSRPSPPACGSRPQRHLTPGDPVPLRLELRHGVGVEVPVRRGVDRRDVDGVVLDADLRQAESLDLGRPPDVPDTPHHPVTERALAEDQDVRGVQRRPERAGARRPRGRRGRLSVRGGSSRWSWTTGRRRARPTSHRWRFRRTGSTIRRRRLSRPGRADVATTDRPATCATPPWWKGQLGGGTGDLGRISDLVSDSPADGSTGPARARLPRPATRPGRGVIVNHETTPPAASSPAQAISRLAVGVVEGDRVRRTASPARPTATGKRGHREQRPGPRDGVVDAARDPARSVRRRGQHGGGQRRDHQRQPQPEDAQRWQHIGPVRRARADAGQPGDTDGHHQRADRHRDARADPARRARRPRAARSSISTVIGSSGRPGFERAVPEHGLQVDARGRT